MKSITHTTHNAFVASLLTSDKDHIVDILLVDSSIFQACFTRGNGSLNQRLHQGDQFGASQLHFQMLWASSICCHVGEIDVCGESRREFNFGFLSSFTKSLNGEFIVGEIDTL